MEAIFYTGSIGLNNKIPAHRLPYNQDTGVAALEEAMDVIIDRTGEIVTRRGITEVDSGDFQALYPGKDWGLIAKNRASDTAIYKVIVSETGITNLEGIRSGLTKDAIVDFCKVNDAIFYTNGFENGMITSDGVSVPWKESAWADDDTSAEYIAPPVAHHLSYNAGRIYFSIDNVLNYTEFSHLGLYNPAINGEQFPTKILVHAPVADGLYVSDREAIYFLSGLNPKEWTSRKVTNYPAKEWGKYHGTANSSFFGFETNIISSLLATENGPLLCMPSGQIENLIIDNIIMPDCSDTGCICLFDETLIIQSGE